MERFSRYRDPSTGVQAFLLPVPPRSDSSPLLLALLPFSYLLGAVRFVLLAVLVGLHTLFGYGLLGQGIARLILLVLGFLWIDVETVSIKRRRNVQPLPFRPRRGDVIVSNWTSYVDLIYLSVRFNPTFLLPVSTPPPAPANTSTPTKKTGRHTGIGSASISASSSLPTVPRQPIKGFVCVSLWDAVRRTGYPPAFDAAGYGEVRGLEEWRTAASGPVVVFPEATTGNGRGVLRFAGVFEGWERGKSLPVKGCQIWVLAFRPDTPTPLLPSSTHPVPAAYPGLNPLQHVFRALLTPLIPRTLHVRLLDPADSPSSGDFLLSEWIGRERLGDVVWELVQRVGRLKGLAVMGWEEKVELLRELGRL